MEIKERKGYFLLKEGDTKIGLAYMSPEEGLKVSDELDIGINMTQGAEFNIFETGEYDKNEVYTMVVEDEEQKAFLVETGDVDVLLISASSKIHNDTLEKIGEVDILVMQGASEISSDTVKLINRIDPRILLLGSNISTPEVEIEKLFGMQIKKGEAKLKVKSSDFTTEEYKLDLIKLAESK